MLAVVRREEDGFVISDRPNSALGSERHVKEGKIFEMVNYPARTPIVGAEQNSIGANSARPVSIHDGDLKQRILSRALSLLPGRSSIGGPEDRSSFADDPSGLTVGCEADAIQVRRFYRVA